MQLQSASLSLFFPFLKGLRPCSLEHQAVELFVILFASFLLVVAIVEHGTPVSFTNRSMMNRTVIFLPAAWTEQPLPAEKISLRKVQN